MNIESRNENLMAPKEVEEKEVKKSTGIDDEKRRDLDDLKNKFLKKKKEKKEK